MWRSSFGLYSGSQFVVFDIYNQWSTAQNWRVHN